MTHLIPSYLATLAGLQEAQRRIRARDPVNQSDLRLVRSMATTTSWALEWIRTGHEPPLRRPASRRAGRAREVPVGPEVLVHLAASAQRRVDTTARADVRRRCEELLACLTPLERRAMLLVFGHRLTHQDAARELGLSRGNTATLLARALRKVRTDQEQAS